jgi:L-ribulose-5-phosphate 4-epimerase
MLEELRRDVWKYNLELPKYGLVVMTSGNISGRDPETGLVVIKPTGYSYEEMTPDDMVIVDLDGNVVEGHLKPSTDTATHLYVYRHRPDVMGIGHTHSTYASSFAALGKPIPAVLTASAMLGGEVPCGGYASIGGEEIGAEIVKHAVGKRAVLLQNHGVFTIGDSARQAAKMAVEVEEIAKIVHLAMLKGQPIPLTQEQLNDTGDMYRTIYGQPKA